MTEREVTIRDLRMARGWRFIRRQLALKERTGPEWKAQYEKIREQLGKGFLISLVGGRGNGKTQIAADLMSATAEQLGRAEYTTATGFFMTIRSTFNQGSEQTEEQAVGGFCNPSLLVIDEYEKRSENEWQNNLLFEVINRRYGMMRDTLLISNLDSESFVSLLGPSISSRMNETGGIIECQWKSFRV